MALFVVHLAGDDTPEDFPERVDQHFPGSKHLWLSDRAFLLRTDVLSDTIADKLGMRRDSDDPARGIVLKLNGAYAGLERPVTWEWLELEDD